MSKIHCKQLEDGYGVIHGGIVLAQRNDVKEKVKKVRYNKRKN